MFDKKLYGKDSKGNIKEWYIKVVGNEIHVSHGRKDGKMQTKVTVCQGKNIGRANETSPETQAILEATSKINKQMDKLYRESELELEDSKPLLPMLAHDYTKVGHRMRYPCHVSPKLDGVRCVAFIAPESVVFKSRGGKQYDVPSHLYKSLQEILERSGQASLILDGELYHHGTPLQDIVSAVKKPNDLTPNLEYWVFDVPSNELWEERYRELLDLHPTEHAVGNPVKFVTNLIADSEEMARKAMNWYLERGFEGMMLRNIDGLYQWNHRSPYLMKWKDFKDMEARVIGIEMDKNDECVLNCRTTTGVEFKCKMKGNHQSRSYESTKSLLGGWITVKYQALTNDGVPQFPVGMCARECDEEGNPLV